MRAYFIIAFSLLTTGSVFAQISMDSIRAIIKQEVAAKRSKSIIVGIIDGNGRRIISEGILSDKNPVPPDANTIYEIGSITKVFTSLLLAEMSLKQQVNLSDPISKFLPKDLKTPMRNGKEISLLSLSTHRSGLPRNAYNFDARDMDNPFADYLKADLYEFISHYELGRDIDAKWQYSNIGYTLLGEILSIVTGRNFDTLVIQDICKPLAMNNTFFSYPPKEKFTIAAGHTEYGKPTSDWDFPLAGGGGLRSNVSDMLTFAAANLGFIKTDLTGAMELSHVLQAKKDGNDSYTTMGWTLRNDDGKQILFKDGGTGGYRTFLGIDKKNKFGVVVLSNTNNIITDIGLHIIDSTVPVKRYSYPWNLLDTLRTTVRNLGAAGAIELYRQLKASKEASFIFDENQLNYLGNELRRAKKLKDAVQIFEFNASEYPKSSLVYESLAETYKRNGDRKRAIEYFEKAIEADPQNLHLGYMLGKLKSH